MSPPPDTRLSRRAALRAGAASLTAGVTALTGCSGLPPLGSKVKYGTVQAPDAGAPKYREWLPAPDAFPDTADADGGYDVHAYEPPPEDAPAWTRGSVARTLVATQSDYVGVHVDDVDTAVGISSLLESSSAVVLAGDIDRGAVTETIPETSYEPAGTENGYEIYVRPDDDRVMGVSADGLVFGSGPGARDIVATIAAARRGDGERYHEVAADFEALSAGAGSRRWTWLLPGTVRSGDQQATDTVFWDIVGRAYAFSHDDDAVYSVRTWLFPEGDEPTVGEVKTALERRARLRDADAVEVTVEGRVATMELAEPVEQFRGDTRTLVVPHVSWRVTDDAAAETVEFRHEAGDTVETERLVVKATNSDEVTDFSVDDDATDFDVGDTVEPGEVLTVSTADIESGATVRLVYRSADRNATATLAFREAP
ncbi:hypothetical protein NDI56_11335 [Haloarcula sp. S1CR25-12]|uniref:Uncharacterized protein n=1 Tax=Haloarcula saliterrae TaxID=2950534 RepID=A0ABU2FE39_9EURY|nr:hypothetical protein [Haloarcula sp. S1CR25-12]MDS0259986.1 hypothetical protein [Haloarcula sp. S1CR25-12]